MDDKIAWLFALLLFLSFLAFAIWRMKARGLNLSLPGLGKVSIDGEAPQASGAAASPHMAPRHAEGGISTGNVKAGGSVQALARGEPIRTGDIDAQGNVSFEAAREPDPKVD